LNNIVKGVSMSRSSAERIKRIQNKIGVEPDGLIGPTTLTELERRLGIRESEESIEISAIQLPSSISSTVLTLSNRGVDKIIGYEVGSEQYYNAQLTRPIWPGASSGVTIGVGYDLGCVSKDQFFQDWVGLLSSSDKQRLSDVVGLKKKSAKRKVRRLHRIRIPFDAAKKVFVSCSLPNYGKLALKAYPKLDQLEPDAQTALVSLVYNRGASLQGARRSEMAAIKPLVLEKNYKEIANQIIQMKRLWEGRGLAGLLSRRDDEAELVRESVRHYQDNELIRLNL